MPEEEEEGDDIEGREGQSNGATPGGGRKFVWSPVPVNTHLARQARTLSSYHSMADLRLTDEEIKRRRYKTQRCHFSYFFLGFPSF